MQKTLASSLFLDGNTLHSNEYSFVRIDPAYANFGIQLFFKTRPLGCEALIQNLAFWDYQIALKGNGFYIFSIEHLFSALYGLGIHNCRIQVLASEHMPALDGSAFVFAKELMRAGFCYQDVLAYQKEIPYPVGLKEAENDGFIIALPSKKLKIHCLISYSHPMIRKQFYSWTYSLESYMQNIVRARTFGFLSDYFFLKEQGYARGSSCDNTLVLRKKSLLKAGLRYKNEFARHKILDFLGALVLLGTRIVGEFYLYKTGHSLDTYFLKKLFLNCEKGVRDLDLIVRKEELDCMIQERFSEYF